MTCHCGNCENHRVDSWKMFDNVQWSPSTSEEVKEALAPAFQKEMRQQLNIVLTTNEKNDRFVVKILDEGAKVLYNQETGIEPMYLAHAAEDYLIPLRNLLESLGYDVQETYGDI